MKTISAIFPGLCLLLASCDSGTDRISTEYVTTIVHQAADGLDLQAVTDLATQVKTAEEFEKSLNDPAQKINNLDLNEDDIVDYIKITEIHDADLRGFSLTTEIGPEESDEQELAVIQFEKGPNEEVTVQTHGNQNIYGNNHYHYHRSSVGDLLLWSYILTPRRPYYSSWGWNRYPSNYSNRQPLSANNYRSANRSRLSSQRVTSSSRPAVSKPIKSPNFNKTASKIKAPLKNPSTSQRSFQKQNPSRQLSSKRGFGSSRSSSSSRSTSSSRFGSSSSSRSRSSFGGGK